MMSKVCVGQIAGAHGVRGLVKLRSFTQDPAAVVAYGPLSDESGKRSFKVDLQSAVKDGWVARIAGVNDRDAAEALRGVRLFVERSALPETEEDEFYHTDLIGLRAETADGESLGGVSAIYDFGAGDMLEIKRPAGKPLLVPFTLAAVPVVDVAGGKVVVDPPEGLFGDETPPADSGGTPE